MNGRLLQKWLLGATVLAFMQPGAWAQAAPVKQPDSIASEVQNKITALPYYRVFDNLTFRADGGTVTLLGQVTSERLKSDAAKAVKQIPGVGNIVNQVELLPPSASDDRLRLAVYAVTYGQLVLNQYAAMPLAPVHIIVKNGNVTLEGTVSTALDKSQFFTSASGVPGIVSVTDHLKIAP